MSAEAPTDAAGYIPLAPDANPHDTLDFIRARFHNYNTKKLYTYDQILFILDEQCGHSKCDRDVARELFLQCQQYQSKVTLDEFFLKYIENVQISKLCLKREANLQRILQQKISTLKGSKKAYVHIKIIQISTYARHSSSPSVSYRLVPTDIPPVTVVNSMNPILNHEYTLELEQDSFSILFYESGVPIAQWTWPDAPDIADGDHHRRVVQENVSFELAINYRPRGYNTTRKEYQEQLEAAKAREETELKANQKLVSFLPFLRMEPRPQAPQSCTSKYCHSFTNFYYVLILLLTAECVASIGWPMQFLDIMFVFGIVSILYDRQERDVGMEMLVSIVGSALLIVKSIWGVFVKKSQVLVLLVALGACILLKLIAMYLAWQISREKERVPEFRQVAFYEGIADVWDTREVQENYQLNDVSVRNVL